MISVHARLSGSPNSTYRLGRTSDLRKKKDAITKQLPPTLERMQIIFHHWFNMSKYSGIGSKVWWVQHILLKLPSVDGVSQNANIVMHTQIMKVSMLYGPLVGLDLNV